MCCSLLPILDGLLNKEDILKLEKVLASYSVNASSYLTVSKLAASFSISTEIASKVLGVLAKENYLSISYVIRCQSCGLAVKKYSSLSDLPEEPFICYSCGEKITVNLENVETLYSVNGSYFFPQGQHDEFSCPQSAAHENSIEFAISTGGANGLLYHPNEKEYLELEELYEKVFNGRSNKTKGESLEKLTGYLFNLCEAFRGNGIKTLTNQIDCFVNNKYYLGIGLFNNIGSRIVIECKNELKVPSGSYISKLHSIITSMNAGGSEHYVKLGIIISKVRPPKTYREHAVKYYLMNKTIIVSLWKDDFDRIIKKRVNLLDVIDEKITEIITDSTTDLFQAGIY